MSRAGASNFFGGGGDCKDFFCRPVYLVLDELLRLISLRKKQLRGEKVRSKALIVLNGANRKERNSGALISNFKVGLKVPRVCWLNACTDRFILNNVAPCEETA